MMQGTGDGRQGKVERGENGKAKEAQAGKTTEIPGWLL